MKRFVLPAALLVAPAVAFASGGSRHVLVTNCDKALYKPKVIFIACADGSDYLTKMTWSKWNRTSATGKGTDEVNLCRPDCVRGHFKPYPVVVSLSKPLSCRKQTHKVFKDIKVTYTGSTPKGFLKSSTVSLGCPFQP